MPFFLFFGCLPGNFFFIDVYTMLGPLCICDFSYTKQNVLSTDQKEVRIISLIRNQGRAAFSFLEA